MAGGDSALDQGRDWLKFLRISDYILEFRSESDRGCAVLAACVFEDFLQGALHWRLGKMGDSFITELAPRGRLSVAISSCALLGIMSLDEMSDARRLVRIRNDFAHKLTKRLSFENPVIKNELRQLKLLDRVLDPKGVLNGRERYLFSLAVLQLHVAHRFVSLERMTYASEKSYPAEPPRLEYGRSCRIKGMNNPGQSELARV